MYGNDTTIGSAAEMATVPFVKATACGNDFLIIDLPTLPVTFIPSAAAFATGTTESAPMAWNGFCRPMTQIFGSVC